MSLSMTTLLPTLIAFGLLYFADQIEGEDHGPFKLFLQMLFFPFIWFSLRFAVIDAGLVYGADAELVETLAWIVQIIGWIFFVFVIYILWNIITKILEIRERKKAEKEEDLFG